MVMAFVLLAVFFVCGLVNSLFYLPPKKLLAWIQALIPIAKPSLITSPATTTTTTSSDKAELRNVFATFDKNSDGIITEEELRESLKNIGFSITDTDLVHMVEKLDSNRDGLIDLEEFSKLYESVGISRSKQRGGRDDQVS
uniref:EF-hand domain-containing protein n=1 Tax=Nelumbo nucifera TaxID=4432 RepID=A0A822ZN95_NELNU|nr:TPA_asm: hypothetical protein HUJ06_003205 [Nelumbo nucifera]